jgi:hypothetical protein
MRRLIDAGRLSRQARLDPRSVCPRGLFPFSSLPMNAHLLPRWFVFLLISMSAPAVSAQEWEWAYSAGGSESDWGYANAIAVDAGGHAYVTGDFRGTATFGDVTLTSAGGQDAFVAKYASDGSVLWAHSAGGSQSDSGTGIAVDADGYAYVTGTFRGMAAFGDVTVVSVGEKAFVAKYAPDGSVLWVRSADGSESSWGSAIAVNAAGNAYVTGAFRGTATFGDVTLTSAGEEDMFVAKYAPDGNVLWARSARGSESSWGDGIALDAAGNAYVTGELEGAAVFGDVALTSAGKMDVFVAKYSAAGEVLWARRAGGSEYVWGTAIAVEAGGNAYVTGVFEGTAAFGNVTLTGAGDLELFVAKYSPTGEVLWARRGGGTEEDRGSGIAVDAGGYAYVTGYFEGTADFGDFTLESAGSADVFVAKYAPDGSALWARRAGGSESNWGSAIAVDAGLNAYVTGYIAGTSTFGDFTLTSEGLADVFVAKLNATSLSAEREPVNPRPPLFLSPLWPNPVTRSATATLMAQAGLVHVRAEVFDALGRRVDVPFEGALAGGAPQEVGLDASRLAPGIYVLRVTGGRWAVTRWFVVAK